MKPSLRFVWFAISLFGMVTVARAEADDLEILGATVSKDKTEVMLVQKSTGTGRWVTVGQTFAGHTVTAYDDRSGQLTLTTGGQTRVLVLKKASVQPAKGTPPTPEQQNALRSNLRQISAAADQYFLEYGVSTVPVSRLVGTGPTGYIRVLTPVAGESYDGMVIDQGQPIRIKTSTGFEMELKP